MDALTDMMNEAHGRYLINPTIENKRDCEHLINQATARAWSGHANVPLPEQLKSSLPPTPVQLALLRRGIPSGWLAEEA